MAKRIGKTENLIPLNKRPKEEQREIQLAGGLARGKQAKEQVLMSRIFADYLIEEHELVIRDDEGNVVDTETLSAKELIKRTITGVMSRKDSASVAMMKTLAETTEGSKLALSGSIETVTLTPEERRARLEELKRKDAERESK
jgi:hypothetical protein